MTALETDYDVEAADRELRVAELSGDAALAAWARRWGHELLRPYRAARPLPPPSILNHIRRRKR